MQVKYKTAELEKLCTNHYYAERKYGLNMADKLQLRVEQIKSADTVEMLIKARVGRCHPLEGDRKGQYAIDLVHPQRLVFEKHGNSIQIALINEIVDYH